MLLSYGEGDYVDGDYADLQMKVIYVTSAIPAGDRCTLKPICSVMGKRPLLVDLLGERSFARAIHRKGPQYQYHWQVGGSQIRLKPWMAWQVEER